MTEEPNPKQVVTNEILDLKLAALRSDLTLRMIGLFVAGQFLSSVTLPTTLTASAIVATISVVAAKAVFWH